MALEDADSAGTPGGPADPPPRSARRAPAPLHTPVHEPLTLAQTAAMLTRSGVTLAYRYASFDPTSEFGENADGQLLDAFEADTLVHHTVGLSYRPHRGPLTLQANFTVAQEDDTRAYANDRVDLLAQLVF